MKWSILIWHGNFVSKIHTYIDKIFVEFIYCNIFITFFIQHFYQPIMQCPHLVSLIHVPGWKSTYHAVSSLCFPHSRSWLKVNLSCSILTLFPSFTFLAESQPIMQYPHFVSLIHVPGWKSTYHAVSSPCFPHSRSWLKVNLSCSILTLFPSFTFLTESQPIMQYPHLVSLIHIPGWKSTYHAVSSPCFPHSRSWLKVNLSCSILTLFLSFTFLAESQPIMQYPHLVSLIHIPGWKSTYHAASSPCFPHSRSWLKVNLSCSILTLFPSFTFLAESQPIMQYPHFVSLIHVPGWKSTYHAVSSLCFPHSHSWLKVNLSCSILTLFPSFTFLAESQPTMQYPHLVSLIHVPGWKSTYHAVSWPCFPHSRSWLKVNLSCSILTLFPSFTFLTESQPIMQYPHFVSLIHIPDWKSTYHAVSSHCFPHSRSWLKVNLSCSVLTLFPSFTFLAESQPIMQYPHLVSLIHIPGWKSTYHAVSSPCFPHSHSWLKVNLSCSILTLFPSFTFLTESQPTMQYPHFVSLIHIPGWKSTYHAASSPCFPHSRSWLKVNLSCSVLTLFPSFTFLAESQPIMQYPHLVSLIHIPGWKSTYHAVSPPCFLHSRSWLKVNLSCSILTLFPSFTFLAESQPIMQYPHLVSLIHVPGWKSTYHAVSSHCFPHSRSWLKVNLPCSILTLFPSFTFLAESQPIMQYPHLVSLIHVPGWKSTYHAVSSPCFPHSRSWLKVNLSCSILTLFPSFTFLTESQPIMQYPHFVSLIHIPGWKSTYHAVSSPCFPHSRSWLKVNLSWYPHLVSLIHIPGWKSTYHAVSSPCFPHSYSWLKVNLSCSILTLFPSFTFLAESQPIMQYPHFVSLIHIPDWKSTYHAVSSLCFPHSRSWLKVNLSCSILTLFPSFTFLAESQPIMQYPHFVSLNHIPGWKSTYHAVSSPCFLHSRSWLKVNLSCSILTLFPSFTFLAESQPIMQYPHLVSFIHVPGWKSTYHAVSSLCFPHSRSWLKVNLSCSILSLFPSFTFLAESQPIMQCPHFVSLIHVPGWKSTYHAVSSLYFPHSHSWLKFNLSCSILTLFPSFTFLAESQPIMQYPHFVSLIHIPGWKSTYHAVSSLCFPHSRSWLKVNLSCSILTLFPSFTFLAESQPIMQYPHLVSLIHVPGWKSTYHAVSSLCFPHSRSWLKVNLPCNILTLFPSLTFLAESQPIMQYPHLVSLIHIPGWNSTYHAVSSPCFPHSRSWLKVNLSCSILTLFPSFTFLAESQPIMQYPHFVSLIHVPGWKSTYHAVSSPCFPHSRSWLKVNLSCSILTLFPSFTFLAESQPTMQYPHLVSLIHVPGWKSTYHAVSSPCFPHSHSWLKLNLSCSILTLFPSFTFLAESQPIMQYPHFVSLIHVPGWKSTYHAVSSLCFPHSHSWLKVNLPCSILTLFPSFTFLAESQPIMQYPHLVSLIHIPGWKSTYHAVSSLCFPHSRSWLKVNLSCSILTLFPSFTFLAESQPTMQYPHLVSLIHVPGWKSTYHAVSPPCFPHSHSWLKVNLPCSILTLFPSFTFLAESQPIMQYPHFVSLINVPGWKSTYHAVSSPCFPHSHREIRRRVK